MQDWRGFYVIFWTNRSASEWRGDVSTSLAADFVFFVGNPCSKLFPFRYVLVIPGLNVVGWTTFMTPGVSSLQHFAFEISAILLRGQALLDRLFYDFDAKVSVGSFWKVRFSSAFSTFAFRFGRLQRKRSQELQAIVRSFLQDGSWRLKGNRFSGEQFSFQAPEPRTITNRRFRSFYIFEIFVIEFEKHSLTSHCEIAESGMRV
jgi:hypothetical protein